MERKYTICETSAFLVFVPAQPHIDRCDGGHIVIMSKTPGCYTLTDLSDDQAIDLIRLAKRCGKALTEVLAQSGIYVGIVNYQINGNWSVKRANRDSLHLHVYGRAENSVHQTYGEALHFPNPGTGFYDSFCPLTQLEAEKIAACINNFFCGEE